MIPRHHEATATYDRCQTGCHHQWHGLPCRACPCVGPYGEVKAPDQQEEAS